MTHQENSFLRLAQSALAIAVLAVCGAGAAHATTITTTSYNTWKTSTYLSGAPTDLDFTAIKQSSYNTAAGIVLSGGGKGFTFTGPDNGGFMLAGDIYSQTLASATDPGAYLKIDFQTAQNAVFVFLANAGSYTVTLSDGEVFNMNTKTEGFSLSHTITGLSIAPAAGTTQVVINDFLFGVSALAQDAAMPTPPAPSPTPEPATVVMLLGGAMLLFSSSRRFAKAAV